MEMTKHELRKLLKAKRLSLSQEERWDKSRAILARLHDVIDWDKVGAVHIFEPLIELGEVDVSGFVDHDELFTSRNIDEEWQMVAYRGGTPIPKHFDVIIVPMLGFDNTLHRLGYGAGFYDKFLATQPNAKKIGVCFEIGHVEHVPAESHDIKLDIIVTETKIYR
jgi:5-formyltetrahydrofolate cyclo-ligase